VRSGLIRPTMQGEVAENAANEVLAAKLLGQAGYRTGLSGKWHLGEQTGSFPTDMGFEHFFGMLGVVDMYQDWQMAARQPGDRHQSPSASPPTRPSTSAWTG
jgi:arylsulfatase A-like enzyme